MAKVWLTFLMIVLFGLFLAFTIRDKSSKEEKRIRAILSFGIYLIILSSVVFALSNWDTLSNGFKALFLSLETIIFLVFGLLLKYVFKIKNTGGSLTLTSIALFNVTYLYIGGVNVFNSVFNLNDKYSALYTIVLLVVDLLITIVYKKLNNKKGYVAELLLIIPIPFLIVMQINSDVVLSFTASALFMLILNITRNRWFKKTMAFNIINAIGINVLTLLYFISLFSDLNDITFGRITLIIYASSLVANVLFYVYKASNDVMAIISPLYASIVLNSFAISTFNALSAALVIYVFGVILYLINLIANRKYTKIIMLIYSYLFLLEGMIIMCFSTKMEFLSIILSVLFVFITSINTFVRKTENVILNTIARTVFIIMSIISIMIQPGIVDKIKFIDVITLINIVMLTSYVIAGVLNKNTKWIYLPVLCLGILIALPLTYMYHISYSIVLIASICILYFYYLYENNNVFKTLSYLLLIITVFAGFNNYLFVASLILVIISTLLFIINKDKHKYMYAMIGYIPLCVLISNLPIIYDHDVLLSTYIFKVFLFLIPVTIFLKGVVNADNKVVEIINTFLIICMFLSFISIINIYVALILGIIGVTILLLGYVYDYKMFIYTGYAFTFLNIIVQTSSLLKELPWWVYLLIAGITLLVIALIKEIKRK